MRHILKASVFSFVMDISRYEEGVDEFSQLFDEVLHYMREKFMQSRDFGGEISGIDFQLRKEKGQLFLQVRAAMADEQKVLMEKMINIVLNKQDLVDDEEIVEEYKRHFLAHTQKYIKNTFGILVEEKELPVFITSAVTRQGVDSWLDALQHYLQYDRDHISMLLFDVVPVAAKPEGHIREVTEETLPRLIEHEYLEETDAKYAKVREVADAEFCRLGYMLPWGNDEAELWFWNVM